ncbi:MAG TPA: PAS domain S-box protein [Polyangia bacterium]
MAVSRRNDGKIVLANNQMETLFGYSRIELLGPPWLPPAPPTRWMRWHHSVLP